MKLPLSRITEFLNVSASGIDTHAVATGYSIDSRTIRPGELFFAVKGEKLDGHDFVDQALGKGAVAAVVSRDNLSSVNARVEGQPSHVNESVGAALQARPSQAQSGLLVVDDTLLALQTLATAVRRLWGKSLIGVTGSTGKTTTKEAIAHVLATRYRVHRSEGNFNNHFGLPLMLLKLEPEHDIAVVEMG